MSSDQMLEPFMMPFFTSVAGMQITPDPNLGDRKLRVRERTWKERLFTLPWQPMKKLEFYTIVVPKGEFFMIAGRIFAHPTDILALEREIRHATN